MAPPLSLSAILTTVVTILLVSIAIHFGAKPFAEARHERFRNAIIVAVVGSLVAGLVWIGLAQVTSGLIARIVALAAWAFIAAAVYHTSWIKGALIGVVAWLLWFLVSLVFNAVFPA